MFHVKHFILDWGGKVEKTYTYNNYPYEEIAKQIKEKKVKKYKGKRGKGSKKILCEYYNIPCAFDIETTSIVNCEKPYGFMYHWQFDIMVNEKHYVCFGTFWEEYEKLVSNLSNALNLCDKNRLVVYVHNLAFEYQFLRSIHQTSQLFATAKRQPLKWLTQDGLEFRCSYKLSNMSLAKFCENSRNVKHGKIVGVYDYLKIRTPYDKPTIEELEYDYNDVAGLCECIADRLEEDTIATIPMTSTGYIRRDYQRRIATNPKYRDKFLVGALDAETFILATKVFRGGNTASNPIYTKQVLENVFSYDIQSSYPAVMAMSNRFPIGKWHKDDFDIDKVKNKCCMFCLKLENPFVKSDVASPYIDLAHCTHIEHPTVLNGRILDAKSLEIYVTEIDFEIICKQYKFDKIFVKEFQWCNRGMLPRDIREVLMELYTQKTQLKNVVGKEYEYAKSKNRVNASYGMMVTNPLNDMYDDTEESGWTCEKNTDVQGTLDKYYNNASHFLHFTWGVYVTALARMNLQELIDICGKYSFVYCDTDSVKFLSHDKERIEKEIEKINARVRKRAHDVRPVATAYKDGKEYCLGIWDFDNDTEKGYSHFRTFGAKKYAYECFDKDGNYNLHITVAGCKKGASEYIEKIAKEENVRPIDKFCIGLLVPQGISGRSTAWFNDERKKTKITVKGMTFTSTSNIAIGETSYTLGITDTYDKLLQRQKEIAKRQEYILEELE